MYRSAEIRWFFSGRPPKALTAWFKTEIYTDEPQREDYYLYFPDSLNTGVKLREGNFEIKSLINAYKPVTLSDHFLGQPEIWEKWSSSTSKDNATKLMASKNGVWFTVKKQRIIKKFELSGTKAMNTDPEDLSQGCNLELTSIEIKDTPFWSLGFEAFGSDKKEKKLLISISKKILNDHHIFVDGIKDLTFNTKNSYSYPEFFHKFEIEKLTK